MFKINSTGAPENTKLFATQLKDGNIGLKGFEIYLYSDDINDGYIWAEFDRVELEGKADIFVEGHDSPVKKIVFEDGEEVPIS